MYLQFFSAMLALEKNNILRRVQKMNSILPNPAETELDIRCITTETAAPEDLYSTTPLIIIHSIYRQPNEDELHSSFEEAISDRVLALNKQLRRLSVPLNDDVPAQSPINVVVKQHSSMKRFQAWLLGSRQAIRDIAIVFMLVMIGFDIMGLLVLLRASSM
jgi:hypothetical protein